MAEGNEQDLEKKINTLTDAVGQLANNMKTVQTNYSNLEGNVNKLVELQQNSMQMQQQYSQQQAGKQEEHEDDPMNFDSSNLEDLDRGQFAQFLMGQFSKMLEKNNKQILEKVETVDSSVQETTVRQELKDLVENHPDAPYWKDEMRQIFEQNPSYSIEDAYIIAKNRNPQKVQEVEQKMQEDAANSDNGNGESNNQNQQQNRQQQNNDGSSGNKQTKGFGGLPPSGGGHEEKPSNMAQSEASEDAWASVMQDVDLDSIGLQ